MKKLETPKNQDIVRKNPDAQIKMLLISRIAMSTFLLGVFVFMQNQSPDFASRISIPYLYGITAVQISRENV